MLRRLVIIPAILWAGPWTLVGLLVGLLGVLSGGGVARVGRVIEFHGGVVTRLLERLPIIGGAAAMTVGHVVLGRTPAELDRTRAHERVHVAQYERWGPFFVPAYFASSAWAWLRRRDPYRDNAFEREAYEKAP